LVAPCLEYVVDVHRDLGSGVISVEALNQQFVVGAVYMSDVGLQRKVDRRLFELSCRR